MGEREGSEREGREREGTEQEGMEQGGKEQDRSKQEGCQQQRWRGGGAWRRFRSAGRSRLSEDRLIAACAVPLSCDSNTYLPGN